MVRLVGVDLPRNKRIAYALTYIHGIGLTSAKKLLKLQILILKQELVI
jgi:small subunit ribosomal protein S13